MVRHCRLLIDVIASVFGGWGRAVEVDEGEGERNGRERGFHDARYSPAGGGGCDYDIGCIVNSQVGPFSSSYSYGYQKGIVVVAQYNKGFVILWW